MGPISILSNKIHYKEAYITGSHGSTPRQHKMAVDLIEKSRINLAPLITHKFSLEEINNAFETAGKKIGLRIIVNP
jgi:L-iditol 2-dehydrogenase